MAASVLSPFFTFCILIGSKISSFIWVVQVDFKTVNCFVDLSVVVIVIVIVVVVVVAAVLSSTASLDHHYYLHFLLFLVSRSSQLIHHHHLNRKYYNDCTNIITIIMWFLLLLLQPKVIAVLSFTEKLSNYCYILAVKRSEKPMNGMHVCGQTIVETSIYYGKKTTTGTVGIVRYSKRYVYYGKKTTTGTVGMVQ